MQFLANRSRRYVLGLLAVWTVAWYAVDARDNIESWHFFTTGVSLLTNPHVGLKLYANAPKLQIGPVSFLVAAVVKQFSGGSGKLAAQLFCAAMIFVILTLVHKIGIAGRVGERLGLTQYELDNRLIAAAFCAIPVWLYLSVATIHMDDVLAMVFGVAALLAALQERPILAGLLVALAVDSKPWAVPFVVVLLLIPGMPGKLRAGFTAAAGIAVAWGPFFLATRETMRALHFTIPNTAMSGLRVLGVTDPQTPAWDRPAQMAIGMSLAALLIYRKQWPAVFLVIMAVRMAIDPGTNRYYTASLIIGALIWDVCGSKLRWPVWSLTVFLVLHELSMVHRFNALHGWLLVGYAIAAVITTLTTTVRAPAPERELQLTG